LSCYLYPSSPLSTLLFPVFAHLYKNRNMAGEGRVVKWWGVLWDYCALLRCSRMTLAICPHSLGGSMCPMSGITISLAPGIAFASATP